MRTPVQCWLVYRSKRVETFTTTVDPADPDGSDQWLREQLATAIRARGVNPAEGRRDYSLDVERAGEPTTIVRLA